MRAAVVDGRAGACQPCLCGRDELLRALQHSVWPSSLHLHLYLYVPPPALPRPDYLPVFLHEIPRLLRCSEAGVDVALIQVALCLEARSCCVQLTCRQGRGAAWFRAGGAAEGGLLPPAVLAPHHRCQQCCRLPPAAQCYAAGQPPRRPRLCVPGRLSRCGAGCLPVCTHGEAHRLPAVTLCGTAPCTLPTELGWGRLCLPVAGSFPTAGAMPATTAALPPARPDFGGDQPPDAAHPWQHLLAG